MTLIEVPSWGTVTLIEIVWLVSGLLAFGFALLRLPSLVQEYVEAKRAGDEHRDLRVIARGYMRREIIRLGQSLGVIVVGLYSAVQPPPLPGPALVSIVGLILTAVLVMISFLVALQSLLDWRDKREVRQILERHYD